ncbi:MAG: cobaltochelatase subunit CobN [Spirochaetaceae bacterium]|jgi:cobaltochelatase CobN|nr:cobaltochelatase subunit CobN [Spirochaetaceae bacterium]
MKKIIGVFWHGQYNFLCAVRAELLRFTDLRLYSSRLLDEGVQNIEAFFADCSDAALILLYSGTEVRCREEIEARIECLKIPVLYLGGDGVLRNKSPYDLAVAAKCNTYLYYSGKANFINLFKYVRAKKLGGGDYDEPLLVPWEGIFHPDSGAVFDSTEEYFAWRGRSEKGTVALVTSRSYWLNDNILPEISVIRSIEARGYGALPVYTYTLRDDELGARGAAYALEKFLFDESGSPIPDILLKFPSFFFETRRGRNTRRQEANSGELLKRLNCPVLKPVVSNSMSIDEWRKDEYGTVKDIAWGIALPELEGVIEPVFIGGIKKSGDVERRVPVPSRVDKLAERAIRWIRLKKKPNTEKKIVFVLNNKPCVSAEASVGGGAGLDGLESVARILRCMKEAGYGVEDPPASGKELIRLIMERKAISEFRWTTVKEIADKGGCLDRIGLDEYLPWFNSMPEESRKRVVETWGKPPGEEQDGVPAAMILDGRILITGLRFGNAIVCLQPKRGCAGPRCDGTVCKILHDPICPPTHQYIATYKWFENKFGADALVHVGTHGNLEFLPGKGTALSDSCFPDICAGKLPCLYLYNSDNPPEGTIAKRRGLAVIVDHLQTVFSGGGLYGKLEELDTLLANYDRVRSADKTRSHLAEHQIKEAIEAAKLDRQINLENYHKRFDEVIEEAHKVLSLIKNTQIQDGLHVIGEIPQGDSEIEFINQIVRYEGMDKRSLRALTASAIGVDFRALLGNPEARCELYKKNNGSILFDLDIIVKHILRQFLTGGDAKINIDRALELSYRIVDPARIDAIDAERERIIDIHRRLAASKETDALLSGLNGGYIPAGPAGVITRGRDDVLPTGRNFFTLDPGAIPTKAAYEVGRRLGDKVIEKFMNDEGRYPENFSMYWMCNDILWADGEGMGQLFYMMGVRPSWLPNGRVHGFEIIPLAELGRPRIDITIKVSGILRDNFRDCMNMMDEAVQTIAALDESAEENYVRKHSLETMSKNPGMTLEEASRRIFGSKPGSYLNGVSLAVYASSWKDGGDFLDLFTYFNGYSYGKNAYGREAFKQLQNSLQTIDITYNKVSSDEHDLLGCCSYFGNHGGMTAAAKHLSGRDVKTYYGDTRETTSVEVRTLADELRRVVRASLFNPKWIEGQKRHGYAGAMTITKRVGRVYGWEASTGEVDDWIFDDITKTFIADEENRKFFTQNNPWALEEMARRLIEAYQRKLWQPEDGVIDEIKDVYLEIESFMEKNMGDNTGEFQGGSIDVFDPDEIAGLRANLEKMKEIINQ